MNLILFGFKGCGKTHFGKLLAKQLHRPFIDTDDLLSTLFAKKTGEQHTPRTIHAQIGEAPFRALESEALQDLKDKKGVIIALGGGTVLDATNVALLQGIGCLVYLCASAATLQKRIANDNLPAFLDEKDPTASFLTIFQERKSLYESIPAAKVDVDLLDEAGVLAALRSILLLQDPPNGF